MSENCQNCNRTESKRRDIKQKQNVLVASTSIYHNPIHSYCQETLSKLNCFHNKQRGNVFLHLCAFCQRQKRYGPYQLAQFYKGEINTGNKHAILERGYSTQKYFKRLISSPPSPLRTLWVLLQQRSKNQVDKGSKHTAGSTLVSHSELFKITLAP